MPVNVKIPAGTGTKVVVRSHCLQLDGPDFPFSSDSDASLLDGTPAHSDLFLHNLNRCGQLQAQG